jgi:hypothetical protein
MRDTHTGIWTAFADDTGACTTLGPVYGRY